ncbi:MAG: hypothetical protein BGO51_12490 [Rhodospirillales bacterium 69-11]|nr:MAG: hypothetical protein BGO51_12490 [Rhodospirillales bacterium 69-11]
MSEDPLFDPADFRIPPGVTHVCAGGQSPFLHRHDEVLLRYAADKSSGMAGRAEQDALVERIRMHVASAWTVQAPAIGFVSNVAEGVAMVAESLDWRAGDTVAVDAVEYPSVVAPFARRPGVTLRIAQGTDPDRMANVIDRSTRVIATSYVSYLTGERVRLGRLRQLADEVDALLVVDFTQAAGCMPIDASIADFAFSACYKWMLGMTGVAIAYWNRRRQPDWAPRSAGWYSLVPGTRGWDPPPDLRPDAMRFTRGNPAHAAVYVLDSALSYLAQVPPQAVQAHVQALSGALLEALAARQVTCLTPHDPLRHAANVCLAHEKAGAIAEALHARGVYAWNGQGRVRFSFHGYNTMGDVGRITDALDAVLREV